MEEFSTKAIYIKNEKVKKNYENEHEKKNSFFSFCSTSTPSLSCVSNYIFSCFPSNCYSSPSHPPSSSPSSRLLNVSSFFSDLKKSTIQPLFYCCSSSVPSSSLSLCSFCLSSIEGKKKKNENNINNNALLEEQHNFLRENESIIGYEENTNIMKEIKEIRHRKKKNKKNKKNKKMSDSLSMFIDSNKLDTEKQKSVVEKENENKNSELQFKNCKNSIYYATKSKEINNNYSNNEVDIDEAKKFSAQNYPVAFISSSTSFISNTLFPVLPVSFPFSPSSPSSPPISTSFSCSSSSPVSFSSIYFSNSVEEESINLFSDEEKVLPSKTREKEEKFNFVKLEDETKLEAEEEKTTYIASTSLYDSTFSSSIYPSFVPSMPSTTVSPICSEMNTSAAHCVDGVDCFSSSHASLFEETSEKKTEKEQKKVFCLAENGKKGCDCKMIKKSKEVIEIEKKDDEKKEEKKENGQEFLWSKIINKTEEIQSKIFKYVEEDITEGWKYIQTKNNVYMRKKEEANEPIIAHGYIHIGNYKQNNKINPIEIIAFFSQIDTEEYNNLVEKSFRFAEKNIDINLFKNWKSDKRFLNTEFNYKNDNDNNKNNKTNTYDVAEKVLSFPKCCLYYQSYRGYFGFSSREFLLGFIASKINKNVATLISHSVDSYLNDYIDFNFNLNDTYFKNNYHNDKTNNNNNRVKADCYIGGFLAKKDEETQDVVLHFIWQADLKGCIPSWIQKFVCTNSLSILANMKNTYLTYIQNN